MNALERLVLPMLLLAAALVAGADYFKLPWLTSLVLVGVGLVAVLGGIRVFRRGEVFEGRSRWGNPRYTVRYTGASARLIAVVLLLAGPILIALGALEVSGAGRASGFLTSLLNTPSGMALILGPSGLMVTALGIARFLSGSTLAPGVYHRHVEWSIRLTGAVFALAGFAMTALAVGLLVVPGLPQVLAAVLSRAFDQAVNFVERWAGN